MKKDCTLILNKTTKNKYGEILTPISINGDVVLCVNLSGETVNRNLSDFIDQPTAVANIPEPNVSIVPIELPPDDVLFSNTLPENDGFYEEQPIKEIKIETENLNVIEETNEVKLNSATKKKLVFNLLPQ
jgi:hypothetical protein